MDAALYAIQRLLIEIRWQVGEGTEHSRLYEMLDSAEVLPAYILEPVNDETEMFRAILDGLGTRFPRLRSLCGDFDRGVSSPGAATLAKG